MIIDTTVAIVTRKANNAGSVTVITRQYLLRLLKRQLQRASPHIIMRKKVGAVAKSDVSKSKKDQVFYIFGAILCALGICILSVHIGTNRYSKSSDCADYTET